MDIVISLPGNQGGLPKVRLHSLPLRMSFFSKKKKRQKKSFFFFIFHQTVKIVHP